MKDVYNRYTHIHTHTLIVILIDTRKLTEVHHESLTEQSLCAEVSSVEMSMRGCIVRGNGVGAEIIEFYF